MEASAPPIPPFLLCVSNLFDGSQQAVKFVEDCEGC